MLGHHRAGYFARAEWPDPSRGWSVDPDQERSMSAYTLPELPYDLAALEPHYSAEVLELHHDKHHAAYVAGANTALEKLDEARTSDDYGSINQLQKNLAFHLSGHVLHSMFWENLSPDGGGDPEGDLAAAVVESFGSVEHFRNQLNQASLNVQGSGWGALTWEPLGQRLIVEQIYDHQSNVGQGAPPLLVLDMWEHAYYLQYRNVKADWVDAFWRIVNWPDVSSRFERARTLELL
jgi:Fe-Mn family superoxide dismutase